VLDFDGMKIQGRDVRVTVDVEKDFGNTDDPTVSIIVSFPAQSSRASMPSVSITHHELHDLFDVVEQAGHLSAKAAEVMGFTCRESYVSIGDFKVAENGLNGLTWGDLGLVTPPAETVQLLTRLKDLAHAAAQLPIPVKRD
jgi:hypothetical protein